MKGNLKYLTIGMLFILLGYFGDSQGPLWFQVWKIPFSYLAFGALLGIGCLLVYLDLTAPVEKPGSFLPEETEEFIKEYIQSCKAKGYKASDMHPSLWKKYPYLKYLMD